jgi:hypothetical protein
VGGSIVGVTALVGLVSLIEGWARRRKSVAAESHSKTLA